MLYVIYNQETDIDEVRTDNLLEAVQQATEIYDKTYDQHKNKHDDKKYSVQIIDMDEEDYLNNSWDDIKDNLCSNSSLYQFITTYGVNDLTETKPKKKDPTSEAWTKINNTDNDYLKNLDEHEQLQVLHFIPDQMLIDELNRRIDEYRKYADAIRDAGEELMIYV